MQILFMVKVMCWNTPMCVELLWLVLVASDDCPLKTYAFIQTYSYDSCMFKVDKSKQRLKTWFWFLPSQKYFKFVSFVGLKLMVPVLLETDVISLIGIICKYALRWGFDLYSMQNFYNYCFINPQFKTSILASF